MQILWLEIISFLFILNNISWGENIILALVKIQKIIKNLNKERNESLNSLY